MAGNLSNTSEAALRTYWFSDSAVTRPTQWFMALYTTSPSDGGGGTEVSAGGYARQEVTFASDGASNASDVVFGPATASWGEVSHAAIFDDLGRFLAWGPLATPITMATDDSFTFAAGAISTEFD